MQIQINIIGDSVDEIYRGLIEFAEKIRPPGYEEAKPAADPKPAKRTRAEKIAPADIPSDYPKVEAFALPAEAVAPDGTPDSEGQPSNDPVDPAKLFEEIKLLGAKLYNDTATRPALEAVRKEFGFQKFMELTPDKYEAVLAKLQAIGN